LTEEAGRPDDGFSSARRRPLSRSGGIGRRASLRGWSAYKRVQVQVLSPALTYAGSTAHVHVVLSPSSSLRPDSPILDGWSFVLVPLVTPSLDHSVLRRSSVPTQAISRKAIPLRRPPAWRSASTSPGRAPIIVASSGPSPSVELRRRRHASPPPGRDDHDFREFEPST
jgi:hypothetical protein